MATTDPVLVQSYRKQVDELEKRLAEVEAERDEAREQVIAAEAEATELALRVEEMEAAAEGLLEELTQLMHVSCEIANAMGGRWPSRVEERVLEASDKLRALLGEGAEDAE